MVRITLCISRLTYLLKTVQNVTNKKIKTKFMWLIEIKHIFVYNAEKNIYYYFKNAMFDI